MKATTLLVATVLIGCGNDLACDEDQELSDGVCMAATDTNDGDPGGVDAGGLNADAGPATFGSACDDAVDHTDCADPAPYCAVQPGAQHGICTQTGCVEDASVCPEGWDCLDLSMFSADLPSICTEP